MNMPPPIPAAQAFGVLISGAVIASSFFSLRGTVAYVEKYFGSPVRT